MSTLNTIKKRRSIRKFKDKPVEKKTIEKILDSARWAPSACNIQGWRFVVVDDQRVKDRIDEEQCSYFLKDSPVFIVVLYDNRSENTEYDDYVQSASAGIQNMLLAAEDLGLGACWTNNIPTKRTLRKILNIPKYLDPIAIVALGYYKRKPKPLERKYKLDEIISYNEFYSPLPEGDENIFLKRVLRKLYMMLPKFVKKRLKIVAKKHEKKFDTEERYENV